MARNKSRARIMHELRTENAKLRNENKELSSMYAAATSLKNASRNSDKVQDYEVAEIKFGTGYDCCNSKPKEQVLSELYRGIKAHMGRSFEELIVPNLQITEEYLGDGIWTIKTSLKILKPIKTTSETGGMHKP